MTQHHITIVVNDRERVCDVDGRVNLADFLRQDLQLTGTHVGCEHGICGACTVLVDGMSVRSCLMFAVQANGRSIKTIESVVSPDGGLHPIQAALSRHHGLQCGYCTPGVVMTLVELGNENPSGGLSEADIRKALSGNLCRCTGYEGMVDAALELFGERRSAVTGSNENSNDHSMVAGATDH